MSAVRLFPPAPPSPRHPSDEPQAPSDRELLSGVVERVTFHNEESGFSVLRVQVRGRRDLVTVVGRMAAVNPGEFIQATGTWVNDKTHGLQFSASDIRAATPTTDRGHREVPRARASSRASARTSPSSSSRAFGADVFDVIERQPERLRRRRRHRPRPRRGASPTAGRAQKVVRDIMVFLHAHGVGTSRAVRIYKTYGADAIAHHPRQSRTAWPPTSTASAS